VPGCSSGEEAYSLAILLRELMEKEGRFFTTQIFATDIDGDAIGTARKGFYPSSIAPDVGAERLKRFFSKENEGYRVDKGIREMLVFAEQDVMRDPPFTRLDLISCRNLLIYMNVELQKKLFPLFHFALREKGILFLGPSETIGSFMHLYASASKKWKIYTRRPGSRLTPQIDFPIPDPHMEGRLFGIRPFSKPALPQEVERLLLDHYTPPGVVINGRGDIVYFHGKTGGFLEPSPGRANMNIKDMAREGLKAVIMGMINRAIASKKSVVRRYVRIKSDGDFISADITVRPFRRTRNMEGLWMILFEKPVQSMESKASKIKGAKGSKEELRIKELEVELKNTRENLQATIEELETMNEELKSTNEEYQSTNEELKSANEELETSREELQSLNEELVTVNNELQQKNERLEQVRNEMKKFLDTMDIAVIILDQKLRVRSFTPQATRLVNLIESDVGRPLSDMSNNLEYDRFTGDVEQVLATGKEILVNVQSRSKNWYLMKVRKLEGERKEDSGVAISFVDISDLKDIEAQLKRVQAARKYAESIVAAVGEPMLILARDLKVISANPVFCKVFRTSKEETIGRFIYELNNGQWDIPELRDLLGKVLQEKMQLTNYKVELVLPKTGKKSLLLNACQVVEDDRGVDRILLAMREDTAR
jgi:two-component system CheB/CheR fusion protein